MLQKTTEIEGLDSFENVDSPDDTNPGAMQVSFELISEEMPYLTSQSGKIERRNFVQVKEVINLGNLINVRRIKDDVYFDTEQKRWKVKKLDPAMSDIKKYPDAWNHFARGNTGMLIGTPLLMLFRHDPSRIEQYHAIHIRSVEQLGALTDANCDGLFMGAKKDREDARFYLRRIAEAAPSIEINNKFEELERSNKLLAKQNAELTQKLTQLLEADVKKLEGKSAKGTKKGKVAKSEKSEPVSVDELPSGIEGL